MMPAYADIMARLEAAERKAELSTEAWAFEMKVVNHTIPSAFG